jgi:hypothetical protein
MIAHVTLQINSRTAELASTANGHLLARYAICALRIVSLQRLTKCWEEVSVRCRSIPRLSLECLAMKMSLKLLMKWLSKSRMTSRTISSICEKGKLKFIINFYFTLVELVL